MRSKSAEARSVDAAGQGRWRRWLPWPRSLGGRLALILVMGMLAAQALTSSVWFDMRYRHAMEMPIRLVSIQLADTLRVLRSMPVEAVPQALAQLGSESFRLALRDGPMPQSPRPDNTLEAVQDILSQSLSDRLGSGVDATLLSAELADDTGRSANAWTLLNAREPVGHFRIALQLPGQAAQWIEVVASEAQGGIEAKPFSIVADYVLRIYVLRIMVFVAIALVAVRLALRPLRRLAEAADALGRDLHSPPLSEGGPREVHQAARTFNLMQRRLIQDIGERTRFLAAVSHDLRSPITRLRLRAEFLPPGEMQDKFRKDLGDMESLISSTLDYIRGADHNEPRRSVDVNSLLAGLRADFEETGGTVTLHGHAREPLPAYASSLRRCVQNLIENAIRYGGAAHVRIDDSAQALRIRIEDAGPGIPEASLEQVFEPFLRLEESRNLASGGTGLGLSIARSIALAHDGSITLRNRGEGGLEALLTLPRTAG
ncbi:MULTISPECIES: ATP-binding protein [unclassified Variovorax]|uniref:ATP-binding protein n=1 Tax=unclassified Variovorax TaxID=663243 RepID=UPI000D134D6C|nr:MULTISPECIES: ATP-binding protein [unclassified Variovorax]AVQ85716.1 two-component sensor histidine kinase [Variovorax sp. PMC12]QRY35350.1 HAMP domain-containing protein [Variovorax sp. PDNC026]